MSPRARSSRSALICVTILIAGLGCGEEPFPNSDELEVLRSLRSLSRPPPSPTNALADDPAAAKMGQRLFIDKALSSCGTLACESCHPAPGYAATPTESIGCNGRPTGRQPPTLLNVGFAEWLMWDGRADSLWSQALLPLFSPAEMAADPVKVRARLETNYPEYETLFGRPASAETDDQRLFANMGKALEAYQRTLRAAPGDFDENLKRYLRAVENQEQEEDAFHFPLKVFVRRAACTNCHKGPMLTDEKFHNIGVQSSIDNDRGRATGIEDVLASPYNGEGAYSDDPAFGKLKLDAMKANRKSAEEEGAFRTPSLRNLRATAPFMHTGELRTMEDVIEFYDLGGDPEGTFVGVKAETVVPLNLSEEERAALLTVMESLSDPP